MPRSFAASLGLAAALAPGVAAVAPGADAPPASRTFRFRYEATVPVLPAGTKTAYLWLPYPPDTPEQTVRDLRVETDLAYEVVSEPRYGVKALRVALAPAAASQAVALSFEVTRRERRNRPGENGTVAEVGLAPDPKLWLGPDRRVPIDGQIARWSAETVGGRTDAVARARAIYDHVVTNLKYDKSGTGWGRGDIYWACDQKRGNCTDFHAVFIGYSRAAGVPARFEMGFPIPPERGKGEIAGYHCWAQFHAGERGWVPVDASEAAKNAERREYFFGAHDENRILFSVGRDLTFPGMQGEPLNFFIYPYAEADGRPVEGIARRFTWEDTAR